MFLSQLCKQNVGAVTLYRASGREAVVSSGAQSQKYHSQLFLILKLHSAFLCFRWNITLELKKQNPLG